jgi:hypothetical protein
MFNESTPILYRLSKYNDPVKIFEALNKSLHFFTLFFKDIGKKLLYVFPTLMAEFVKTRIKLSFTLRT